MRIHQGSAPLCGDRAVKMPLLCRRDSIVAYTCPVDVCGLALLVLPFVRSNLELCKGPRFKNTKEELGNPLLFNNNRICP